MNCINFASQIDFLETKHPLDKCVAQVLSIIHYRSFSRDHFNLVPREKLPVDEVGDQFWLKFRNGSREFRKGWPGHSFVIYKDTFHCSDNSITTKRNFEGKGVSGHGSLDPRSSQSISKRCMRYTRLMQTPHYCGQFALSLGKEIRPLNFSKFNPLK